MTRTSAEIVNWISSHRSRACASLVVLMVSPVMIFAWSNRHEATLAVNGSLVILGIAYGMLALALVALLAWLYAQVDMGTRFSQLSVDLFCIIGFDGYFKYVNSSWSHLLGFTNAELMSRPYLEFVHPDDRSATVAEAERLQAGEAPSVFDNRYVCANGSYKWLVWSAICVPGKQQIYAVARDITDIKHASEVIERQSKELEAHRRVVPSAGTNGKLPSGITYHLRTQLNAIAGFSGLLADGVGGQLNSRQKRFLDQIRIGADELMSLVGSDAGKPANSVVLENPAEPDPSPEAVCPIANEVEPAAEDAVILLVDDDASALKLLDATLRKAGFQTRTALNGKAALSILFNMTVHAIVADLVMPEMDGFELIRVIRQDAGIRHVPLFVLTSSHLSRDEIKLLSRQTQGFFQKGRYWGPDLVAAIEAAIRKQRATNIGESA